MSTDNLKASKNCDMKNYNKEYYEKNKEKYQEKVICECGEKYTKYRKSLHEKSQKHKNKLIEKENLRLKNIENIDKIEILKIIEKQQEDIVKKLNILKKMEK